MNQYNLNALNNPWTENFGIEVFLMFCVMFLFGSMIGYFAEVLYRRFFSAKKWVNPGFLKGPWVPLYGFGLTAMFFLSYILVGGLPKTFTFYNPFGNLYSLTYHSGPTVYDLIPIGIIGFTMIFIEFIAGLIFVKGFKVKLWDYSNMKGNILGIICPVFSAIWFIVTIIYYYLLNPFFYELFTTIFNYIFGHNTGSSVVHLGLIFSLGIIYGVMLIDFINSANLFSKISKFTRDKGVVATYEKLKEEHKKQRNEFKNKLYDILPRYIDQEPKEREVKKLSKIEIKIRKWILIDPEKENTSENYDENGRPKKED